MRAPDKKEARRRARAALSSASPADPAALRALLPSLPRWGEAKTVAAYCALPEEPDLHPIEWTKDRLVLLPRMEGATLVFCAVADKKDLKVGKFGVLEPTSECPVVDPACADIIFVPGLAFTEEGARLGRGGGFYDRTLAALPDSVLRVGVCFASQVFAELPTEPHDEPVDMVLAVP